MKNFKKIICAFVSFALFMCLVSCASDKITSTSQSTEQITTIAPKDTSIVPKDTSELIVFLHAGGSVGDITHLNAQETFAYYYKLGYRYFEYDLRLSSEGRLIASHAGEHLGEVDLDNITYEEFKDLRLENGYTPANEEWIMETLMAYPDVRIIVDAKMDSTEGDAAVLKRLEDLEAIYGYDISENIIPEIFSVEMWDIVKETTTFDKYLFSHYKVYYTVSMILEYFSDSRIWGVSIPIYADSDFRSQIYRLKETKLLFVFTPLTAEDVLDAATMGADGVYLDSIDLIHNV